MKSENTVEQGYLHVLSACRAVGIAPELQQAADRPCEFRSEAADRSVAVFAQVVLLDQFGWVPEGDPQDGVVAHPLPNGKTLVVRWADGTLILQAHPHDVLKVLAAIAGGAEEMPVKSSQQAVQDIREAAQKQDVEFQWTYAGKRGPYDFYEAAGKFGAETLVQIVQELKARGWTQLEDALEDTGAAVFADGQGGSICFCGDNFTISAGCDSLYAEQFRAELLGTNPAA